MGHNLSGKMSEGNNRKVTRNMVEKWIIENDKALDTILWLKFDVILEDHEHVLKLKCKSPAFMVVFYFM